MPEFEAVVMCFTSLLLTVSSSNKGQCAEFIINHPFVVGNKMYIREINTALNFSFSLKWEENCQLNPDSQIEVIKNDANAPAQAFFIKNMTCVPTGQNRTCIVGHRELNFSIMINPSSESNSTWKFTHQSAPIRSLQIVSTSPPKVINVSITTGASSSSTSGVVPAGSTVFINCSWDSGGHPQVPPQQIFLNSNKSVHLISNSTNPAVYQLQNATCDDAGTVTCSIEGSNRTAALRVGCPPDFGHNKRLTLSSELKSLLSEFPVKMPTDRIINCTLRPDSSPSSIERSCTRNVTAYGDPPYLKLNLSLLRLEASEVGVWELRVTNEYGSGSLFIYARSNSSEISLEDEKPKNPLEWEIPLAIGVFLIVIAIIVAKVISGFRKEKTHDQATTVSDVVLPPIYRGSNVSINISNDLYVKLADVNRGRSPLTPCDAIPFGKGDYAEIGPPLCGYGGGNSRSQIEGQVDIPVLVEETKEPLQKVSITAVSNLYVTAEEVRRNRPSTKKLNITRS